VRAQCGPDRRDNVRRNKTKLAQGLIDASERSFVA